MDPTGVVVGLPPSEPTPHAHAHPPTHPHAKQRRRKKKNLCESPGCTERALLRRPRTNQSLCRECFYLAFETEVHETILAYKLFDRGDRVALCASGGKDSTVLAHVVTLLNARYDYGLDLCLLSIDEGISGYRDDSLDTVKRNEKTYGVPLHVFSYKDLYGWTMDEIVAAVGTRNNCTFCGVFRRQALDRGAHLIGVTKMATGHNADDIAETVLLNMLRNDVPRLGRCGSAVTGGREGEEGEDEDEDKHEEGGAGMHSLPRVKPFKRTYEKEIVMYAYFKKLDYFSTVRGVVLSFCRSVVLSFCRDRHLTHAHAHAHPSPVPPPSPSYFSSSGMQVRSARRAGLGPGIRQGPGSGSSAGNPGPRQERRPPRAQGGDQNRAEKAWNVHHLRLPELPGGLQGVPAARGAQQGHAHAGDCQRPAAPPEKEYQTGRRPRKARATPARGRGMRPGRLRSGRLRPRETNASIRAEHDLHRQASHG